MTTPDLASAVKRCIEYIGKRQRSDGGFDAFISADPKKLAAADIHPTIFVTALIAQCCGHMQASQGITAPACDYLLRQRSDNWSWNYWQRDEAGQRMPGYPDDMDDTACALSALALHDMAYMNGGVLGYIGQQLVAAETQVGGPYRTWLVPARFLDKWHDVDLAVNANIACLLAQLKAVPPALEQYLAYAVREDSSALTSNYYPDELGLLYLIGRSLLPTPQTDIRRRITRLLAQPLRSYSQLQKALLLATACRAGCPKTALQTVAKSLFDDCMSGRWYASAFYIESRFQGKPLYAGSAALTAACVGEALSLYGALEDSSSGKPRDDGVRKRSTPAFLVVKRSVIHIIGEDLRRDYQNALELVRVMDEDGQISGLPLRVYKDIGGTGSPSALKQLQVASINGWLAYTLYDNVLDAEDPAGRLCTANVALRRSIEAFRQALPEQTDFQGFVHTALDIIDAANAWETVHSRVPYLDGRLQITTLPDYRYHHQLADRSWGHVLASCAVLALRGFRVNGPEMRQWQHFFRHFLIARQLNDDAHDWREDLGRGQLSAVVTMLLADEVFPLDFRLEAEIPILRQRFWRQTVVEVCDLIEHHIDLAETALAACDFIHDKASYYGLLTHLRGASQATRHSRSEALAFLRSFTQQA